MKLFSKFKNQNDDLEAILINKTFSTFIKNLLLSMVYKIEVSYKDYAEVKQVSKTSNDVLFDINKTVENYCDFIQLAEPNDGILEKNKVLGLTNLQERSIFSYPTESALLYSILSIMPKYYYIKEQYVFKNIMQQALVDGYISNTMEIIQDFNGWTWENSAKPNTPHVNHLIYQNLIDICGEDFMTKWRNDTTPKNDYIKEIKKIIEKIDPYNEYYTTLEKLLYKLAPTEIRISYSPRLNQYIQELAIMDNKQKYISKCKLQIQSLNKEIARINSLFQNPKLLNMDFQKNLKKSQINDINKYAKVLANKRNNYSAQAINLNKMMNPVEYTKRKKYLEDAVTVYQSNETKDELLIKLQLEYLKLIGEKIKTISSSDDIKKYIYKIRYYKKINVSSKKKIENVSKICKEVDKCLLEVINKACQAGILKTFSLDEDYNFEIYKIILGTNLINLNEIKVEFSLEDKEYLLINIYDKEAFETRSQLKYNQEKHNLQVKTNKFIKIFM